jgi:siroheme synthase-like protein
VKTKTDAAALLPLFLKLEGKRVLLVGGGPVAAAKAGALADAGASLVVVSPAVVPALEELASARRFDVHRRPFETSDLDGAWLVVAAAPPEVNRQVAAAAAERRVFVVAVDDPASASAYGAAVLRRDGVTLAIATDGRAPALAGLLREGLDAVLPDDLQTWTLEAQRLRRAWRQAGVPIAARRPLLLDALNRLYHRGLAQELEGQRDGGRGRAGGPDGDLGGDEPEAKVGHG